jgi:LytS/YehU family sensor histidine kinase
MNFRYEIQRNRVLQVLFLFLVFHAFWLLFYILSEAVFLKSGLLHIYFKQSLINSIGFIAFCLAVYWLFPFFISKNQWGRLVALSLILVISLGYVSFKTQNWEIKPFQSSTSSLPKPAAFPTGKKTFAAVTIAQPIGAPVRAMLNILVYLLLGMGYAYMKDWFIKDRRTRILEKEKLQAELTLLRYQLNPHFLFNTINDIYYLAIIQSDKTADAILKVSNLLRYALNEKEEHVDLDKEIHHLKEFVNLQRFRFPDQSIYLKLDVPDRINHLQVAPLLLITYAENAFKHGEPGTVDDPIQIHVSTVDQKLLYTVHNKINNNPLKDATTGIGLNNLRRRLSLLYPDRHQLNLKEENGYFTAHLQIELS